MNCLETALVIGITGAIGGAVARHCEKEGLSVYGVARTRGQNVSDKVLVADLLDERSLAKEFDKIPQVDLVVFAQGIRPSTNLVNSTVEHTRAMLDAHVTAILVGLKALLPKLTPNSCVVLLASSAATKGSYDPSYAAAKGATVSLTRSLAKELKDRVRVTCVAPGLVAESPVHRSMTPEHAAKHEGRMFGGRLIRAEEVASLIWEIYRNPGLNGCVLPIDGGFSD